NRVKAQELLERGTDARVRYLADPKAATLLKFMVSYASAMDSAADMIAQGNPTQAIPILRNALKQRPNDPGLMNNLSAGYWASGQREKALKTLRDAIKSNPDHFGVHNQLASYLLDSGQADSALPIAQRAAELDPDSAAAQFNHGKALCSVGRHDACLEKLNRAKERGARDIAIFRALGGTAAMLRQYEQAGAHYEEGVAAYPNAVDLWLGLAEVRIRLDNVNAAREAWAAARGVAPNHPRVSAFEQRLQSLEQQP
ncbi:MAG: tetratricopeptide repeat protein, partial [Phycisphaerae bacterium]